MRLPSVRPTLLLVGVATVSCVDAPAEPPAAVRLQAADVRSLSAPAPVAVRAEPGRLVVQNVLGTPDPCQDLSAASRRGAATLTLDVTARQRTNGGCVAVTGAFAYTASVPAPAGAYRLVVRHVLTGGAERTDVALDTAVVVP